MDNFATGSLKLSPPLPAGSQTTPYLGKRLFQPIRISAPVPPKLGMVITIPCFNEATLLNTLNSLWNCERTESVTEIIIHINAGTETANSIKDQNQQSLSEARQWIENHPDDKLVFLLIFSDKLPPKHAGVGLARKIAMDEAAFRLTQAGMNHAPIVCLDADCEVAPNYLKELEKYFRERPKVPAASIYFEHSTCNLSEQQLKGIIQYELHLRYYVHLLRTAGYPFAYQTVGSSMVVRNNTYQSMGGMNRRKAGEDFYFLHKIMPKGNFGEITATTVYPSARVSARVPFGTGKAMGEWLNKDNEALYTYHPDIVKVLSALLERRYALYKKEGTEIEKILENLPQSLNEFLQHQQFISAMLEANQNASSPGTFEKRFFQWLDGLKVLQLIHHLRDTYYPNLPVALASRQLLFEKGVTEADIPTSPIALLQLFRKLDKPA